jgi:PAS domain-containing protein
MNFKLLRLTHRFLLQIVFFFIYLAVLSGLLFYFIGNLNRASTIGKIFSNGKILLSETYITYNDLLTHTDSYDEFFQTGQNEYTLEFQTEINQLNDTLKSLMKSRALFKIERIVSGYDSVSNALASYNLTFNQLILAIKEKGTGSLGELGSIKKSSIEIIEAVKKLNNTELIGLTTKLVGSESEYYFAPNQSVYFEIESILGDLLIHPALDNADPLTVEELRTSINTYQVQLADLNSLYKRIGSSSDRTGLKGELPTQYKKLTDTFSNFEKTVFSAYLKFKLFMIILAILIALIITGLYIFLLILFFRNIKTPLDASINFSYDLSKGKTPDQKLSTEVPFEYSQLNSNLNAINSSILEKRQFVEDLLKQKFRADLSLQGRVDTFGKTLIALKENMRKTREEQLKHAEENQIRRYQNEGIAKFSDILRSNSDNLMKLSDIFIKEIVKYLEAIQGGLFLLNKEGDEELQLVSSFAYNRKKYQQKTIRLGESLVGTCALERKTINLTDIPDEYIEITSGMGDAPPNNLILFPIMHEEHLIGVMELASIKKFDENQIILGEKIASSLASTIISARVNSQTSELLQKSQQQAAEMAEQEEEMRQNMEELKATQEESARREEELEGILNAIDQAFYVIEYDFEGTIQKVNQRFLYLVNLHADKVIGKTHSQLFGKKSKADALLFANVSEGNTVELNEKIEVNGIALNLKNTFSPIKSKEGKTIRILNIITINL